jgi:Kef-type K+ transport system membrane component KefB
MPVFTDLFTETTAVLALAAALSALGAFLRQPLIVAYIAAGVIAGPAGLGWVSEEDPLDLLAQMGITLLLFVVGLKLDPRLIRTLGRVVLGLGLIQVAITAALGYGLAVLLGLSQVMALYVGLGLAFSSTVVIVKMLSDAREIDALHGRIALGILIVQDLVVVIAMVLLTAFDGTSGDALWRNLVLIPLKGVAFLGAVALAMRYVLPRLLHFLARSRELLTLAAIAWALALAGTGHALGFSHEVGAFVAGVALAATPYHEAIGARLSALRDFLLLFFFIDLGTHVDVGRVGELVGPALALSGFALLIKPLIIASLLGVAGYRRRTTGLTALTMGQISEFSLILAAMGMKVGHLDAATVSLMTLVALVTIAISGYLIGYLHPIYAWLAPWLKPFERRAPQREAAMAEDGTSGAQVILLGLGRYGERMALDFAKRGLSVLGLDFDPERVRAAQRLGIAARYGDAGDADILDALPLQGAQWVVSSIREADVNRALLYGLRQHGFQGRVAVATHHSGEVQALRRLGADLILQPYEDAADQAVDLVVGHDTRPLPLDIPPEPEGEPQRP